MISFEITMDFRFGCCSDKCFARHCQSIFSGIVANGLLLLFMIFILATSFLDTIWSTANTFFILSTRNEEIFVNWCHFLDLLIHQENWRILWLFRRYNRLLQCMHFNFSSTARVNHFCYRWWKCTDTFLMNDLDRLCILLYRLRK